MTRTRHMIVLLTCALAGVAVAGGGRSVLDEPVRQFSAERMPLRTALAQLEALTGARFVFSDALVDGVRVNSRVRGSLRDVLRDLLGPTSLAYTLRSRDEIVVSAPALLRSDLAGIVYDAETGEHLPYASVVLSGTGRGTSANAQGRFLLVNVPAGICSLRVSHIGYAGNRLVVGRFDRYESARPLTVQLRPEPVMGIEVEVTADDARQLELQRLPGQLQLPYREVYTMPRIGEADAMRALTRFPGIGSLNDASGGLYIRGGTPAQNLVLLDGITVYHLDHFFGFVSAFNTEAVKDVRVYKSGVPARFGGRTAGIIELTGNSGSFDRAGAAANINLLSASMKLNLPFANQRGAWLLSARRSFTDLVQTGLFEDIYAFVSGGRAPGRADPTQLRGPRGRFPAGILEASTPNLIYYDVNSKLTVLPGWNSVLTFSVFNSGDDVSQADPQRTGAATGAAMSSQNEDQRQFSQWGTTGASARWIVPVGSRLMSNFLISGSAYRSESAYGRLLGTASSGRTFFSAERSTIEDLTIQVDNELHLHRAHRLDFGVGMKSTTTDVLFTAADTARVLDRNSSGAEWFAYIADRWELPAGLLGEVGARLVHYASTSQTFLEPRVAVSAPVSSSISLKASWSEAHQFVTRISNEVSLQVNRDFWLIAGDDLPPGFSAQYSLGATWRGGGLRFDVDGYVKRLRGVAEFTRPFFQPGEQVRTPLIAQGNGTARGLELFLSARSPGVAGYLGYTLADVEYDILSINRGEPYPASHDRRHEFKASGELTVGKWTLSTTGMYGSGTPWSQLSGLDLESRNNARLPATARIDFAVHRTMQTGNVNMQAGFSILNLLDRRNVWRRDLVALLPTPRYLELASLGFTPSISFRVNWN